ncbi:MAG: hypothetical protein Q7V57_00325 [Actinomycetota bacterium]|nr:hypothetical protein [Actinomycetota bacterium]
MTTPTVPANPVKAAAVKAPAKKVPAKPRAAAKKRGAKAGPTLPENHTPSEAAAHALAVEFIDLTPSINRIMNSALGEEGRMHAITLFRNSLGVPGDENRTPANAIAAGEKFENGK